MHPAPLSHMHARSPYMYDFEVGNRIKKLALEGALSVLEEQIDRVNTLLSDCNPTASNRPLAESADDQIKSTCLRSDKGSFSAAMMAVWRVYFV